MNEQRMLDVLARIEDENEDAGHGVPDAVGLDMSTWYYKSGPTCGTVACLAGHAAMMEGWVVNSSAHAYRSGEFTDREHVSEVARRILGMTGEESQRMFFLKDLSQVYQWTAFYLGMDETVLREKVQANRRMRS